MSEQEIVASPNVPTINQETTQYMAKKKILDRVQTIYSVRIPKAQEHGKTYHAIAKMLEVAEKEARDSTKSGISDPRTDDASAIAKCVKEWVQTAEAIIPNFKLPEMKQISSNEFSHVFEKFNECIDHMLIINSLKYN